VLASPHSGRHYPPAFVEASRLDRLSLRRSEDGFVDEIFAEAPELGAPLLRANFPRAYVDANREPFELDPRMFVDPLPAYANTRSPRVAAGLGTIARVVANGADIYRDKLSFSEALRRIRTYYWPYHATLRQLLDQTKARFGGAILVDCHSMPSIGGPMDRDAGHRRVDFVLGDCHGTACNAEVTAAVEDALTALGYHVTRNTPYSGGFVTRHYGRPETGVHALQIEVNRALYMDERKVTRGQGLSTLARDVRAVVDALATLDPAKL
jgi:N-formylglutamate amidohydrolase